MKTLKKIFSSIYWLSLRARSYLFWRHLISLETISTKPIARAMTNMMPRLRTRFGEPLIGDEYTKASCDASLLVSPRASLHWLHVSSSSSRSNSETKSIACSFGKNSIRAKFFSACKNFLPLWGQLNCHYSMKTANWSMLIVFQKNLRPWAMTSYHKKLVQENAVTESSIFSSSYSSSIESSSVSWRSHSVMSVVESGSI